MTLRASVATRSCVRNSYSNVGVPVVTGRVEPSSLVPSFHDKLRQHTWRAACAQSVKLEEYASKTPMENMTLDHQRCHGK